MLPRVIWGWRGWFDSPSTILYYLRVERESLFENKSTRKIIKKPKTRRLFRLNGMEGGGEKMRFGNS
jgi:hypothetical protein